MSDQTTITITESTLERFNDLKADTKTDHVPEMSADVFLNSLLDTHEKVKEMGYDEDEDDIEPEDIRDQLQRIESAAQRDRTDYAEIENRLENVMERTLQR